RDRRGGLGGGAAGERRPAGERDAAAECTEPWAEPDQRGGWPGGHAGPGAGGARPRENGMARSDRPRARPSRRGGGRDSGYGAAAGGKQSRQLLGRFEPAAGGAAADSLDQLGGTRILRGD